MKVSELMQHWQSTSTGTVTRDAYTIKLPVDAAARVAALAELYPGHNVEQPITDLHSAALEELETSLPYVRGEQVVGTDEQGDPLYEDIGPTPRYLDLTRRHLHRFKAQLGS